MSDLRDVITEAKVSRLRNAYDAGVMRSAMLELIVGTYPPIAGWNREIESAFYGPESPLAPIDRERCLVALLAMTGPSLSFSIHVYWALMEGVPVAEICHIVGLAACYGGVPRLASSFPALRTTLEALRDLPDAQVDSHTVLQSLVRVGMKVVP